ncbi:hypothetical protein [Streptomyces chartreusis]|uniref:hypothetical protein n=1 Tax=Streptomyces chartreusis TaxID=1969 RepID=UPI0036419316
MVVLVSIIGGGGAGILHRVMEEVSYFEALKTGCVSAVTFGTFLFVYLTFTRPNA